MLDKAKNQGKPRRYLRNINVRWFGFDLSDVQEMRIIDDEVERYSIRKGDLVVCEGGEPGRCAIWCDGETVCFQKALHRIRFNTASDPRFYMYYLWMLAKSGMLSAYYTGTGIKHLTGESLKKLPVPVPPLLEQKRIVARIEELFSELDNGVETLKKTKQQLAVYRQAVLKAAFEGCVNSNEIEDLVDDVRIGPFGTVLHKEDYIDNGIPVINPQHIKQNLICPSSKITVSTEKAAELSSYCLKTNDVIMGRRGEMGRVAAVGENEAGWICGTGSIMLRLKKEFDAKFYAKILSSPRVVHYLEENATGTTMKNLNEEIVKHIPVPKITRQQQVKIDSMIKASFSVCDSIEKTVDDALQQAESMRQSILKKAFEGGVL
jgi:type I restriction enzyme S subunit